LAGVRVTRPKREGSGLSPKKVRQKKPQQSRVGSKGWDRSQGLALSNRSRVPSAKKSPKIEKTSSWPDPGGGEKAKSHLKKTRPGGSEPPPGAERKGVIHSERVGAFEKRLTTG